jgi:NAD(P)-dependent dehydrogenase (short-subunit alcohol dehydrogenase family)
MNLFNVKDKTVLITGASRGIGKTLALGLRDAGAIVYGAGIQTGINRVDGKRRHQRRCHKC